VYGCAGSSGGNVAQPSKSKYAIKNIDKIRMLNRKNGLGIIIVHRLQEFNRSRVYHIPTTNAIIDQKKGVGDIIDNSLKISY